MQVRPNPRMDDTFPVFSTKGSEQLKVLIEEPLITVLQQSECVLRLKMESGSALRLTLAKEAIDEEMKTWATLAAIEALTATETALRAIELEREGWQDVADALLRRGVAIEDGNALIVLPELFWQLPDLWLPQTNHIIFPQILIMTNGKRHPRRAPKPSGEVYARYIPWLGQVMSFRTLDIGTDLERFNRWMNDPRVAYFWNEEGDLQKHRTYLDNIAADPHMMTLIGCLDGVPFSYFEIYWAKENRLAPYYDVDDYDRGWHVVVGEDGYRGRQYVSAWLPSLMHYLFLDDCRTQRIVGEPRADHHQQIRNLEKSGFANMKNFDFPHKRATLVMLLRERFFGDRLWIPRTGEASQPKAETAPGLPQDSPEHGLNTARSDLLQP